MSFRIIIIILGLSLFSCVPTEKKSQINFKSFKKYKNHGFTLIYDENVEIGKSLDSRSLMIFHKLLKKKSFVKITNPENGKSIIAEVKSNKVKFSNFFNSVITQRIADELQLDRNDPFIEVTLISKNNTFIAKKTKTFEEEKMVAEKAPIDGVQINDLKIKSDKKQSKKNKEFSYIIKIADFYYEKTAKIMIDRIRKETNIQNPKIIKLSKTKYRVLLGPFNDINSIKKVFEKIKVLNFENLEVLKNV